MSDDLSDLIKIRVALWQGSRKWPESFSNQEESPDILGSKNSMVPFFKQIHRRAAVVLLLYITGTALSAIPYMSASEYPERPRCLHHEMARGDDCGMANCPMHHAKKRTSQSTNYGLSCPQPEMLFLAFHDSIAVLPVVHTLAQPNPAVKPAGLHKGAEIPSYKPVESPPPKS